MTKVLYFQEQGLGVFLEKLKAQGWLDLFTNTKPGYSVPELAEFYANCVITSGNWQAQLMAVSYASMLIT